MGDNLARPIAQVLRVQVHAGNYAARSDSESVAINLAGPVAHKALRINPLAVPVYAQHFFPHVPTVSG
jgi:hypothetical protein